MPAAHSFLCHCLLFTRFYSEKVFESFLFFDELKLTTWRVVRVPLEVVALSGGDVVLVPSVVMVVVLTSLFVRGVCPCSLWWWWFSSSHQWVVLPTSLRW